MTFSSKFRCYIGVRTLAPWPTTLGGLLPLWVVALGPDAAAQGVRPLTPRLTTLDLGHVRAHSWRHLASQPTTFCPWCRGPRCQMYIFAKFVPDHIFLQNCDKINIKKFHDSVFPIPGRRGSTGLPPKPYGECAARRRCRARSLSGRFTLQVWKPVVSILDVTYGTWLLRLWFCKLLGVQDRCEEPPS
jgi:hypothetical protein